MRPRDSPLHAHLQQRRLLLLLPRPRPLRRLLLLLLRPHNEHRVLGQAGDGVQVETAHRLAAVQLSGRRQVVVQYVVGQQANHRGHVTAVEGGEEAGGQVREGYGRGTG